MRRAGPEAARRALDAPAPPDARLLAVAEEHLRRFGPRRLTVTGVAEAAGMTHANVYRYFHSKTALVDAVTEQWLKRVEAMIATVADAPDPADDKLERLLQEWARSHRALLRENPHLFDAYCDATEARRPVVRRHRARMRQLTERVLDEGLATGKFEVRDRERATIFISDIVFRFINPLTIRVDSDMPLEQIESRLAALIQALLKSLS